MSLRAEEKGSCRVIIQWGCARREDGTVRHLEHSQGHWVTRIAASWDDWWEQTRHARLFTITDTHTCTHSKCDSKKHDYKHCGTDHIPGHFLHEHTCRTSLPSSLHCPPVLNLVQRWDDYDKSRCKIWMQIHQPGPCQDPQCVLERHYSPSTDWKRAFLKGSTLNRRQANFIFCHPPGFSTLPSICLCGVFMRVDSSATAAPLGIAVLVPPQKNNSIGGK